jgi:hypothetical protein
MLLVLQLLKHTALTAQMTQDVAETLFVHSPCVTHQIDHV